jgi:hypothetical protein
MITFVADIEDCFSAWSIPTKIQNQNPNNLHEYNA